MGYDLNRLSSEFRDILSKDSGSGGREQMRQVLEKALVDDGFVKAHLGPDNNEPRKILYEDPDMGFCIVAHVHEGAKDSKPHDHGSSWAIYGQTAGTTTMIEWKVTKPRSGDEPAAVEASGLFANTRMHSAITCI